jgi:hypothetical protein
LAEALLELERNARAVYRSRLLQRLSPPSYTQLLGIDEHLLRLEGVLTTNEPPWIVALAGIGGIGKTSLADALVRRLVDQGAVQEVGWVTARQTVFQWDGAPRQVAEPALTFEALAEELVAQLTGDDALPSRAPSGDALTLLRGRLKERPHLIVVDNLETLADVETLVTALRELAAPTKFLLTSRESLYTQPDIYHYAVPELAAEHALRLIRQEAGQRNLSALQTANDAELLTIVEVVGGNPLALRLVVGQTYVHPLAVVLANLAEARGERIEGLYSYIYRQAWDRLDEPARRTLLVMPLIAAAGADLAHLARISEMEPGELSKSLETLVRLNLVDVRGGLHERRYTIHNLTRAFLHEQVIRWQSGQ